MPNDSVGTAALVVEMAMQKPQQVWQGLAAELGAIDIAMQGAYKVFSCMDEEDIKVRSLLFQNEC